MITTSLSPAAARLRNRGREIVHERELQADLARQSYVVGRMVTTKNGGVPASCAPAHVSRPSPGPSITSNSRRPITTAPDRRRPLENLRVDLIWVHHPGVQLVGVPEPMERVSTSAGHVAVQRHRDVCDQFRHRRSDDRHRPDSSQAVERATRRSRRSVLFRPDERRDIAHLRPQRELPLIGSLRVWLSTRFRLALPDRRVGSRAVELLARLEPAVLAAHDTGGEHR